MKVILNKDIPNLGEEGDIKTVARGYARNFLIPKSLVMPYTREAIAILESRRERLDQRRVEKQKAAMDIKTRLETEDLVLEMPAGDRGRLFGSVTSATIVDALAAQGISIERRRLEIPEKTIKSIGTTRVRVRLYGDEEAELKVVVRAVGSTDGASARPEAAAVVPDVQADDAVADTEDTAAVASDVDDAVADETATEVEDTED
jgi:large subunit ribosomal protein L9